MHINGLDGDAHLAGMIIAAFGDWLYDRVEIGAPINDDGCDPAMLERATGSRRQDRAQSPTDLRRSDEAQEGDGWVGREGFGEIATFGKQRLHPAIGHASLVDQLHEFETAERRCHGRLHDDRAAGCYGGRDLMHDEVERMVEGRDRRHYADRLLDGPGAAGFPPRGGGPWGFNTPPPPPPGRPPSGGLHPPRPP